MQSRMIIIGEWGEILQDHLLNKSSLNLRFFRLIYQGKK